MRKALLGLAVGVSVVAASTLGTTASARATEPAPAAAPKAAVKSETYELLFKEGVLDPIAKDTVLDYAVHRNGWSAPRPDQVDATATDFEGALTLSTEAGDTVRLTLAQGEKTATAGTFPRSVGNPVIMYFLESVLRDMASQAGGSPFYIRNRIKAALLGKAEVKPLSMTLGGKDIQAKEVTIHPFAQDKSRDRMHGFADLTLVAVLSDQAPGWYVSLSAEAPTEVGAGDTGYSSVLTLEPEAM